MFSIRHSFVAISFFGASSFLRSAASAQSETSGTDCTPVGGLICEDTTWAADASPYCATSSIIVGCGATLTIEPGVRICFPRGNLAMAVGSGAFGPGVLVARGEESTEIVFTSCESDATPGDWVGINFTAAAVDASFDNDGNYTVGSILEHVIVEYAGAGEDFGSAAVVVTDSSPFLARSTIRNNNASGISATDVGDNENPFQVEGCTISDNSAGSGGGVYLQRCDSAALADNSIIGNSARSLGGGIRIDSSRSATLTGNTISGNSTRFGGGGGIYVNESPFATLTGNTFSGNSARTGAAGIYFFIANSATLAGNTISGNSTQLDGGGVRIESSHSARLTGNTISGNTAQSTCGGIYLYFSRSVMLTGNTLLRNRAGGQGGAMIVWFSDDVTLSNTVVSGNTSETLDGGAGGVYVNGSRRFSLSPEGAPPVSLLDNGAYDIWNDNVFGPEENDIEARNIWWGTTDVEAIQDRIWDFFDDGTRAIVLPTPWSTSGFLDFTGDGEILRDDFPGLFDCLSGPGSPVDKPCSDGDADRNGHVDVFDFASFQTVVRRGSQP